MHIVIYCPGMPFNGQTLSEGKSLGGSESAGYYMARELARLGHQLTVFTQIPLEMEGFWEGVRYLSTGPVTEQRPLGENFEWFAQSTPHDCLIVQRHPLGFSRPTASKVNFWWAHDLGLKRLMPQVNTQLWNTDRVLAVSEYHKKQLTNVYDLPADRVEVLPNGVDPALFPAGDKPEEEAKRKKAGGVMVYSSRPERGLEFLVGPGGVMEKLAETAPELTLKVAGYENTTPQMKGFYQSLWARCELLPNVELVGALSKKELSDLMRSAWLHVYPTLFEEVSCISVMEAQSAGTPVLTSQLAALPETLRNGGVEWLSPKGLTLVQETLEKIQSLRKNPAQWDVLHQKARMKAREYPWESRAKQLENLIENELKSKSDSPAALARHLLRHSDIMACFALAETTGKNGNDPIKKVRLELEQKYSFVKDNEFHTQYEDFAQWQKVRNIDQGHDRPETLLSMPRFMVVAESVAKLPKGAKVLDYACGQGHFTSVLAARHPEIEFHGVDIAPTSIAEGLKRTDHLENLRLSAGTVETLTEKDTTKKDTPEKYDLILALEVLEHVPHPGALADSLETLLMPQGQMCITVPFGPWEAESFEAVPFRQHIHHLERADLLCLFGHKPDYQVLAIPVRHTAEDEPLGSFQVIYSGGGAPAGKIDLAKKLKSQAPRETVTVCMVCSDDGGTLGRTLESVKGFADQIVIGIDGDPENPGPAWEIARRYNATSFPLASPLETGFDKARNLTLERAQCEWVLWIDDDEVLEWPQRISKYLRPNGFGAYAIKQHHYAVEPQGILKTDFPCRLFRRKTGVRFYGLIHEHPEKGLNQGLGKVMLLPDVAIAHSGYETEEIRRKRFHRNLPLMNRDRNTYPERHLGKFLWVRDLAHLIRYALEGGEGFSPRLQHYAEEAVALWRTLLNDGHIQMAVDALPYYSQAVELLKGEGIRFEISLGAGMAGIGDSPAQPPPVVGGSFYDTGDIRLLTDSLIREKTTPFEEKYF